MKKQLPSIVKKLSEYYKLPHNSIYLGLSHELTNNGHNGNERAALKTVMRNLKSNPSHYHDLDPKYAIWHAQQSSGLGDKQSAVNRQLQQDNKINEKWSMRYKKGIDCSNPKGFSQKAHCRGRKLRQSGHTTKSKPVTELQEDDQINEYSYSYAKYWFTPNGNVINAGDSHEQWIIKNDPTIPRGATLIDTYENAVKKGYVRGIYDTDSKFLMLSNLPNYDFAMSQVRMSVIKAIKNFIAEKDVDLVGSGKGKILNDFSKEQYAETISEINDARKLMEGWKDWAAAAAIGLGALQGDMQAAQPKKHPIKVSSTKHSGTNTSTAAKNINLYKFLNALHQVESSGRTDSNIVGDRGKALGPLQIHREYWDDVKNIVGGNYDDVRRLDYSKKVVAAYLSKYAKNALQKGDWETLARIHNGGPKGYKNSSTKNYWEKVKKHLNEYFGFNYYF